MEDLLSCSNPLTRPAEQLLPRKRLCQASIASQRYPQHSIASNQQSSIRLPTRNPKSAHSLSARPREPRKLFALGITTNDAHTRLTQDAIVDDDEAFDSSQSVLSTDTENGGPLSACQSALSTDTENAHSTCNALLPLLRDAHGSDKTHAYLNASKMLTASSELCRSLTQNVHVLNDFTSGQSSTIQAQNQKILNRKSQQLTYLFAALASSVGITSLAGASVYYRFAWQMEGGEVPWTEMFGTFSLALGAAVGMEYWARWAHRALWHASLWSMHESHHRPRDGPFELNDVFAIINSVPAIALMAFGFLHKGLQPGLCFGAGLGITVFGIAYMFVHDGLVHRRFPVGPIADVPYFQKVAAAHQLHHADTFNGVPYGLFLGPMELEEVGGRTELEKLLQKRKREYTNPING